MRPQFLVTALLLIAPLADADILRLRDGGQLQGDLEEVVLKTGGSHKIIDGESIASLTVTGDANAKVVLKKGDSLFGTLASLRVRTRAGTRTLSGSDVKSLAASDDIVPKAPPVKKPDSVISDDDDKEDSKATTEEQKKLLALNKSVWEESHGEIGTIKDDDEKAVKKEYQSKVDKVVDAAKKVNSTIQSKIRERERREREYRAELREYNRQRSRDRNNKNSNYRYNRRAPQKPRHNDGLEKDQRELAGIRSAGIKLKRIIGDKMSDIERAASDREDRIKYVYYDNKKKILAGEELSEKAMRERFKNAMTLKERD